MTSQSTYCTYVTFYSGNKLPPFYIGSSSVERINSGYHGSVASVEFRSTYKSELKQNPHLFKTKIISTHPTRPEAFLKEYKLQVALNVIKSPLYMNKGTALSPYFVNGPMLKETRTKISKTTAGRPKSKQHAENISKGKKGIATKVGYKDSPESNAKRSATMTGRTQMRHTCPHCGLTGGNAMTRWHFENCRQIQKHENV